MDGKSPTFNECYLNRHIHIVASRDFLKQSIRFHKLELGKQTLFASVQKRKSTCALMGRISPLADKSLGIMETLFLVYRESIEETNEDKRFFLTKLKMFNDMGEALSDYLRELTTALDMGGGGKDEEPDAETATLIVNKINGAIRPLSRAAGQIRGPSFPRQAELRRHLLSLKRSLEDITRAIKRPPKPRRFTLRRRVRRP